MIEKVVYYVIWKMLYYIVPYSTSEKKIVRVWVILDLHLVITVLEDAWHLKVPDLSVATADYKVHP